VTPAAEIARLKASGIIDSSQPPGEAVDWGQLATVINRVLRKIQP